MVRGRRRWLEVRHAMGLKAPGGRPRGVAQVQALQQQAAALLRAEMARIEERLRDPAALARLEEQLRQMMPPEAKAKEGAGRKS